MKKWLITVFFAAFLAACGNDDQSGITMEKVEPNEDVQTVIDMTADETYASLIYSEKNTSYLLINALGEISATAEADENVLKIYIEDTENAETVTDEVYAFELDQEYEKIRTYLNGQEIQFDVWYE